NVRGEGIPAPFKIAIEKELFKKDLLNALDEVTYWFTSWMKCKDMDKESREFERCFPHTPNFIIPEFITN
ncbi:MAG: hypothetical protein AAFY41_02795, partial [Bacteroidota bacterium]